MSSTFSHKKIAFVFSSLWLAWLLIHAYIVHSFGIKLSTAFFDSLITHLILGITSYITYITLKYYQPTRDNFFYIRLWAVLLAIANTFILSYFLHHFFDNQEGYAAFYSKSISLRFCYQLLMITTITLLNWMAYNVVEQQTSEMRNQHVEQLAREAELYNLRQQLQPHFLFNSLNSISALAGSRPEEARRMIQQLSEFLRHTLRKDEQQMVTLKDEMYQVNLYLEIEKVRFGHRLNTEIEMSESCGEMNVPVLVLQPLVENAIKFGLYDTLDPITLKIVVSCTPGNLLIKISNPFDATTSNGEKGTGFGLTSVQRRLYLLFARTDLVQTEIKENIFTIALSIPQ